MEAADDVWDLAEVLGGSDVGFGTNAVDVPEHVSAGYSSQARKHAARVVNKEN